MKYASILPLSAILVLLCIGWLTQGNLVQGGLSSLQDLQVVLDQYFYLLIFIVILLESIVYVGFYFPGQFFAVLMVISSKPSFTDVLILTVLMVLSATLGSFINYQLGRAFSDNTQKSSAKLSMKKLLLAMIHMNSLAFFMFSQGANRRSISVVFLAGLLNLPYYLLLIAITAYMSEEVMQLAESQNLILTALCIWLLIALYLDFKKHSEPQVKDR